jgi:uncharacterized membrane-anchored protein
VTPVTKVIAPPYDLAVTVRDIAVAVAVGVWIVAVFLFLPQSGDAIVNPIPLALLGSVVIIGVGLFLRRRA